MPPAREALLTGSRTDETTASSIHEEPAGNVAGAVKFVQNVTILGVRADTGKLGLACPMTSHPGTAGLAPERRWVTAVFQAPLIATPAPSADGPLQMICVIGDSDLNWRAN